MRELQNVDSNVLAELPDRQNITKLIQRERSRGMPTNPKQVDQLGRIPDRFRKTLAGENFLLYDSFEDANAVTDLDDEETNENEHIGRVLIFATKQNLCVLAKSKVWYVDGTFKTSPTIFYQLFAVMGSVSHTVDGTAKDSVFPLVYA